MNRITLLPRGQLCRIESDGPCCFPHGTKTQHCPSPPMAGVAGEVNILVPRVNMVDDGQAFHTTDQGFDGFECEIMFSCPSRENFMWLFVVKGVRTIVWSARFGRNPAMYLTRPGKLHTSVAKWGFGHFMILLHFEDCGFIPYAEMWCPKKLSSVTKNWHFLAFRYKCKCWRACIIKSMCSWCVSRSLDQMTTSSIYTWQNQPMYSWRAAIIWRWWIGGAFFNLVLLLVGSELV